MPVEAYEIFRVMPQRYPMLMIDRVIDFKAGERVLARKAVSLGDHAYKALPDQPEREDFAYPDALLIEALAQSAGLLLRDTWKQLLSDRHLVMFGSFAGISIRSHATPGDLLDIEARLDSVGDDAAVISGRIECDGRLLMEARSITAVLRPISIFERRAQ